MSITTATSDVVISERGGGNPRKVALSQLQCSWVVNEAGLLTGRLHAGEARALGLPADLRARWLDYAHPLAGPWGGFVTAVTRVEDGFWEVTAEGWLAALRKRLAGPVAGDPAQATGTAGSLLRRLLAQAAAPGPTWLREGVIEEAGPPLTVEWGAEDCYDAALPMLTTEAGNEVRANPDRTVDFGRRVGRDLTGSVRLGDQGDGADVAAYRLTDDLWLASNVLSAAGSVSVRRRVSARGRPRRFKVYVFPQQVEQREAASIGRWGPLAEAREYAGVVSPAALGELLRRDLAEAADPPATAELTLAAVGANWVGWREGDSVRLELGREGWAGTLRVLSRALDADRGLLMVAGEATREPVPQRVQVVTLDGRPVVDSFGQPVAAERGE